MLAVCVYAILVLAVERFFPIGADTRQLLDYSDFGLCILFGVDFLVSLAHARNRWRYLRTWGWIDLVSSIPAINVLRIGRAARVVGMATATR
jgi:voltage-gated potassium channel